MTTGEAVLMIPYFWEEKRDIERWVDFDRDALAKEFPAVLKAWDDYKAAVAVMDACVRDMQQG